MMGVLAGVLCALVLAVPAPASTAPAHQLVLGVYEQLAMGDPAAGLILNRIRAAGGRIVRVGVNWGSNAPNGQEKPRGFDPRDPNDPMYAWSELDAFVRQAKVRGLEPLLTVFVAPGWAEGRGPDGRSGASGSGSHSPDPGAFGDFARALAAHFDGRHPDPANPAVNLPRVRYFQAWNEPNFGRYLLVPGGGRAIARHYVRMLNSFYAAVKRVSRSNVVITAGLGPFGFNGYATDQDPQVFMRSMLCLRRESEALRRARKCATTPPRFDAWAHHPYSLTGTPTSKGASPDAGSAGNVPEMVRTLRKAESLGLVRPRGRKEFWITEFDFFSNPPGMTSGEVQLGKPLSVQARYLSESAYRFWRAGVSTLLWYPLRDITSGFENVSGWPGGLYFAGKSVVADRPKPVLRAFQFPFFADRKGERVLVWSLVPGLGRRTVQIERRERGRWKRVTDYSLPGGRLLLRTIEGRRGFYRARVLSGAGRGLSSPPYPSG